MNQLIKKMMNSERGFAPIVAALFLIIAALFGTYLVQNRTNILPFAEEGEENWNCDGDTCTCDGDNCGDAKSRTCTGENAQGQTCQGTQFTQWQSREGDTMMYGWKKCEDLHDCEGGGGENPPPGTEGGEANSREAANRSCGGKSDGKEVGCTAGKDEYGESYNGFPINGEGYMKGDVCFRKIYKYAGPLNEKWDCCTTPLTDAANQDECIADAQNTDQSKIDIPGSTTGSGGGVNQCPDNGMVFCDNGLAKLKKDGEMKDGNCEYHFEDAQDPEGKCQIDDDGDPSNGYSSNGTVLVAGQGPQVRSCTEVAVTTENYLDPKVVDRLIFYYAIVRNETGGCVKADLGVPPEQKAQAKALEEGSDKRQLYLCNGGGELKWRVVSVIEKDQDNNPMLTQTRQEDLPKDRAGVEEFLKDNITEAERIGKIKFGGTNYADE